MRSALLRVALAILLAVGFFAEQSIARSGPAPSSVPAIEMSVATGAVAAPSNDRVGCAIPALGCADWSVCMCSTVLGQYNPLVAPPSPIGIAAQQALSRRLAERAIPPESPPPNVRS